jgi:hypothetical protein
MSRMSVTKIGEARPGRLQRRLDLAHDHLGLLGSILALDPAFGIERGRARHEHERAAGNGPDVERHDFGAVGKEFLRHVLLS